MSEHEYYFVNLAGVAICVDCSDGAGHVVLWVDAHGLDRRA